MYLRTPKRYRPGRKRQLRLFSGRAVFTVLLVPVLVYVGWMVWSHRSSVRSSVMPHIELMVQSVQTQVAPAPTPTATPNVAVAQAGCTNAYREGDLEEAIKQCEILAQANPNDVDLYYDLVHTLVITSDFGSNAKRMQEALDYAEKAVNANPEAPGGWAVRAMALDWSGEHTRALASALHAKALDNTYAPTYAILGGIYVELGQAAVANDMLDQGLELDTAGIAVADTFRTRAYLLTTQGDREEAIRNYQLALQQAPNQTYIAVELAYNYIATGDIDQAIAVLSSSLERNSGDTSVLFALGNAYTRYGNVDRAFEYYRRCLDVDQNNVPCLSYLGGLQWTDGDFATAAVNLQRAIELGSTDPDDFFQLGRSQASLGRCDLALPYLRQGYQIVVEREDTRRQADFASALQSCGERVTVQPATDSTGQ